MDEWMGTGEVARKFEVGVDTVRSWADKGRLPSLVTPNGQRRFPRHLIEKIREDEVNRNGATLAQDPMNEWMKPADVARMFGVNSATVGNWARTGRLPYKETPGGARRYPRKAVEQMLAGPSDDSENEREELPDPSVRSGSEPSPDNEHSAVDISKLVHTYVVEERTARECGELFGITPWDARRRLLRAGVKMRPRGGTRSNGRRPESIAPVDMERLIIHYVVNGLSLSDCAKLHDVSLTAIRERLKAANVQIRHRGRNDDTES